jgi:hypothetical protein
MFFEWLFGSSMTRFRTIAVVGLAAMMLFSGNATTSAKGEDATALLTQAATTMAGVQTFQFELSTVQGQSTIFQNLELAGVEGSVQRPDRFQAKITAKVAIIEVTVDVIGIGTHLWVTDQMSRANNYVDVTGECGAVSSVADTIAALINPDRLLLTAVGLVQNPIVDGNEKIDGTETTRITGTVDLSKLEQFATATPEFASDLLIFGQMPVTIWIDDSGHVVSLEIEGPLTKDESPDVVRRLDLFDFDQPVTIEEPPTAG